MTREIGPKEKLYDEQISPLVSEVIKLCIINEIPLLFAAHLDGDLGVMTGINRPSWGASALLKLGIELMSPKSGEQAEPEEHARRRAEMLKYFTDVQ